MSTAAQVRSSVPDRGPDAPVSVRFRYVLTEQTRTGSEQCVGNTGRPGGGQVGAPVGAPSANPKTFPTCACWYAFACTRTISPRAARRTTSGSWRRRRAVHGATSPWRKKMRHGHRHERLTQATLLPTAGANGSTTARRSTATTAWRRNRAAYRCGCKRATMHRCAPRWCSPGRSCS